MLTVHRQLLLDTVNTQNDSLTAQFTLTSSVTRVTSIASTCYSDPTYSMLVHSCFQYISLLCTRYPPGLRYRPPGHVPTPQIAPELMFVTRSSTGITLPIVPSLQTLVPTTWHAPDTDPDGLYSLPEPSGPCVLPSSYLYIDPRHISAHVSRPPAPDRPPDGSG